MSESAHPVWGTIAEFRTQQEVIDAANRLRSRGFTHWDIYGPAPIEEIEAVVPTRRGSYVTIIMAVAAVAGACFGYFLQYWITVINYPINVGGRPLNSWPGFVPTAWEICALFTVWFGFFAFVAFCRLPRLYHPIFGVPGFERATQDRFFICVEATDALYRPDRLHRIFGRCSALSVSEVAA